MSERSHDLVFVTPSEDVSGINRTAGVVAEAAQLQASVGKLKENNSTLVNGKVVEALM